jgi:Ca2+-binding RTX toxin-like protein
VQAPYVVVALAGDETLTLKGVQLSSLTQDNLKLDYTLPVSGTPIDNYPYAREHGQVLLGTDGNDILNRTVNDVTLAGGLGDDTYVVQTSATKIIENPGEGIDTIQAWPGSYGYSLPEDVSVENVILMNTANTWIAGNSINNIVKGNVGANIIDGKAGDDVLIGGGGKDLFVIGVGMGSDVITDFSAKGEGFDRIRIDGMGSNPLSTLRIHQVGVDTEIKISENQTITLLDVQASDITNDNFIQPVSKAGMIQTFADEFDSFSRYQAGAGTWTTSMLGGGNAAYYHPGQGEQQAYVDTNFRGLNTTQSASYLGLNPFSLDNGHLIITASPVTSELQPFVGDQLFTSGFISTESSFAQTYGYFEMSAQLPTFQGTWPAFWLLPEDQKSPSELDVFESLGQYEGSVSVKVHAANLSESGGGWVPVGNINAGQHTYGVLWTPYELTFFVDGVSSYSMPTPTDMNRPMYIVANLAIGSNWGGQAAPGQTGRMSIDYIRAYQLSEYSLATYSLAESKAPQQTFSGTPSGDYVAGSDGPDRLDGIMGADLIVGKKGDDTYVVNDPGVTASEKFNEGIDTVLSSVSYTMPVNVENLTLTGAGNIDATGNTLSNIIVGNSGNNRIFGGQGNDLLTGGLGDDTYVMKRDNGSDVITDFKAGFGAGDVVQLSDYPFSTFEEVLDAMRQVGGNVFLRLTNVETLVFRGHSVLDFSADDFELMSKPLESGITTRYYQSKPGGETIYGTVANERFSATGTDHFYGGAGDDVYVVGPTTLVSEAPREGVDTVLSWSSYVLPDNVENLYLTQAAAATGNKQINLIRGSAGNDTLNGMDGNDWLTGGSGKDTFVFSTRPDSSANSDTITDFDPTNDTISIDHTAFIGIGMPGTLPAEAFYTGATVHAATDRVIYDKARGDLYFDADGSGLLPTVKFAHVTPGLTLAYDDFIVS